MIEQLSLFEPPGVARYATADEEAEYIALGILRHGQDLSDHQRGWIELDWDTAGGDKKGDLIPAWICCVCGGAEPNAYWLLINHYCGTVPGCPGPPEAPRKGPHAFRLAPEHRWPTGGAR